MKSKVFLTPTDTTIGFISQSKNALDIAKKRVPNKVYITALPSLKKFNKRIPKIHKSRVRRAKKTTFILNPTFSFRVVKNSSHNLLLNRLGYAYTSSANQSNRDFDYNYAYKNADIIVYHPTNSKQATNSQKTNNPSHSELVSKSKSSNTTRHSKLVSESQTSQPSELLLQMQKYNNSKPSTIYKLGKTKIKKIR